MLISGLSALAAGHGWAREALEGFASQGLLRFDSSFQAPSAASRWEMALSVARLVDGVKDGRLKVTTAELGDLRRLVLNFKTELSQLGVSTLPVRSASAPMLDPGPSSFTLGYVPSPELGLPPIRLSGSFLRDTPQTLLGPTLDPALSLDMARLKINWDVDQHLSLDGGLDVGRQSGVSSPALARSPTTYTAFVTSPFLGVNRRLTSSTSVNLDLRYFSTNDYRTGRPLNAVGGGWQVNTNFVVRF